MIILGATRSGKTSGPFQYIMRSFIRAGFGGVFFCVKPESMADYLKFARAEGMEESGDRSLSRNVILFGPSHGHRFNFLTYEMQRYGHGKAIIENIVELLMQASEVLSRTHGSGKRGDFFEIAMRQLLRNCLEVVIAATDKIDLEEILKMVQSLPNSREQAEERYGTIWSMELLRKAEERASEEHRKGLEFARNYITQEWPSLADPTRSSIAITLSVLIDSFLRYPLHDLFGQDTTVTPDDILNGKILIVDVPINRYYDFGKIAAVLWKTAIQRAILSRPELHAENLGEEHFKRDRPDDINSMRPVFLAGDEAQYFVSSGDTLFATTSASARGITVYSTQSLALLYSEIGSDPNARSSVLALLGNLRNRFVCNVDDPETTSWFANTLGKVIVRRRTAGEASNKSFGPTGLQFNTGGSESESEQLDFDLQPRILAELKQGGPHRDPTRNCKVEAIVTTAGRPFEVPPQKLWHKATFDQNLDRAPILKENPRTIVNVLKSAIAPSAEPDEVRIVAKPQR